MNRFDQIAAWVVVAVVALAVGGGFGFWWLNDTVIAPSCGDVAKAQLTSAVDEIQHRIPNVRFVDGFHDDCDSGGDVSAGWEHDDLNQLRAEAKAAGCWANEPDPADDGEYESLTCKTTGRDVILIFELGAVPVVGDLHLS